MGFFADLLTINHESFLGVVMFFFLTISHEGFSLVFLQYFRDIMYL